MSIVQRNSSENLKINVLKMMAGCLSKCRATCVVFLSNIISKVNLIRCTSYQFIKKFSVETPLQHPN